MHERANDLDPMQVVFDGAEAATGALSSQEGCEEALRRVIFDTPIGPNEQMVWALIDSMAHFRMSAMQEILRLQKASCG